MNALGWAGAETQLYHLASSLAEAGNSVRLLAVGGTFVEREEIVAESVEIVLLGASGPFQKALATRRIVGHARWAEVVHCTGWDASLWGRLGGIFAGRPVLFTEHTPGRALQISSSGGSRQRAIALHNRLLDRFTYAAIAVGAWQSELLVAEGVRPESIIHIPNGVPVGDLRRRAEDGPSRADLGIPAGARVVIQVARFSPQKGQSTTLRTIARLRERLGDVRVIFVGEGTEEERVRGEAAALGAEWAQFLGRRSDVPGLLRLADLSVLPSTGEGLPMSLIESIAVGAPVVATDVGDVGWLLATSGAGIAVPPGDEAAFERACERVLGDPETHDRLVRAGVAGIHEFDARLMTERYEYVFGAAIADAPKPLLLPAIDLPVAPLV